MGGGLKVISHCGAANMHGVHGLRCRIRQYLRGEGEEFGMTCSCRDGAPHTHATRYCDRYGIELDGKLAQMVGVRPVVPWRKFVNGDNAYLCNPEVCDGGFTLPYPMYTLTQP